MIITVIALVNWTELKKYDIEYEGVVDVVTPQFVKKLVKDSRIRGKAFIIIAGKRVCYAAKHEKEFLVQYLT